MAVVGIMLIATIPLSGCRRQLSNEEHIERISERVRARFFEGSEFWMEHGAVYTDFRVTILYNHLEEPTFFMVEFEPDGFFYGRIYENRYYMSNEDHVRGSWWERPSGVQGPFRSAFYRAGITDERMYLTISSNFKILRLIPAVRREDIFVSPIGGHEIQMRASSSPSRLCRKI